MVSKKQIRIELNQDEKSILRKADEILKEIIAVLVENKSSCQAASQEGISISECFWDIYKDIRDIDNSDLIPY